MTNDGTLNLTVPHRDHPDGVLSIDTGDPGGIALPAREWRRWKEAHPGSPITLQTVYTPADDIVVTEEAWADQMSIGPLVLTDVPIAEAAPSAVVRWGSAHEGTLGMAALKRLDLVVDGTNDLAYLRAKKTNPSPYFHNRLGAVFVPTSAQTNSAVAHVVKGGPAYDAGVRDGDVLLEVDEVRVIGWTSDWRGRFYLPSGTRLNLTLKRDERIFKTTATLREILKPSRRKGNETKR